MTKFTLIYKNSSTLFHGQRVYFPCIEAVKWIINHINPKKHIVENVKGNFVGVFLAKKVEKYYKLLLSKVFLTTTYVKEFHDKDDVGKILASWWKEDNKFIYGTNGWYGITILREPYMYPIMLLF